MSPHGFSLQIFFKQISLEQVVCNEMIAHTSAYCGGKTRFDRVTEDTCLNLSNTVATLDCSIHQELEVDWCRYLFVGFFVVPAGYRKGTLTGSWRLAMSAPK